MVGYRKKEAELFTELARYFKAGAKPAGKAGVKELISLIEKDLEEKFPLANEVSEAAGDRGARRALVWSEKVTRMLKSLLTRYAKFQIGNLKK